MEREIERGRGVVVRATRVISSEKKVGEKKKKEKKEIEKRMGDEGRRRELVYMYKLVCLEFQILYLVLYLIGIIYSKFLKSNPITKFLILCLIKL